MTLLNQFRIAGSLVLFNVASAQSYNFTVDPSLSYFKGGVTGTLKMSGSILGNYDMKTGVGTRTKPGWSGSWPAGQNDPVAVSGLLAWDGKTRGVVELPAIPQIGSHLLLEFEEDADPTSCEVLGVSMSVKASQPAPHPPTRPPPVVLSSTSTLRTRRSK